MFKEVISFSFSFLIESNVLGLNGTVFIREEPYNSQEKQNCQPMLDGIVCLSSLPLF